MNRAFPSLDRSTLSGSAGSSIVLAMLMLFCSLYLFYKQDYGVLITLAVLSTFLILKQQTVTASLLGIFAYLVTLGDIRRIATLITGDRALDPLLLVGAGIAVFYATPQILRVKLTDPLSKGVLAVMVIMFLQIFNPRQGGILVGVSGALFSLVPLCWFWIGRRYATDRVLYLLFFRVLVVLGVLGALLAIYQTFVGFLPWEKIWAEAQGSSYRLTYGGNIRPFGFSNSGAEYGTLMCITSVIILSAVMAKRRVYLLVLPIVITAMVLSAQRGPLVRMIFGGAIMLAVRAKNPKAWIPRLVAGLVLGIGLLSYSATRAEGGGDGPISSHRSTADVASTRVTQGLAHPFDDKYSTGGVHFQLILAGIANGFINPIGAGLGANSLGAAKFSNEQAAGTEVDVSDQFSTLGFIGGFLYVFIIFSVLRALPSYITSGPAIARITAVGILACLLGSWIALAQYGTGPIAWFCIGAIARYNDGKTLDAVIIQNRKSSQLADRSTITA